MPRAAELRELTDAYLADVQAITADLTGKALTSAGFSEIYHIALSADTVLRGLAGPKLHPQLSAARSIILRLPFLVSIGQQSVAMVELRRFVELICWTLYFSDHPVEWRSFKRESGTGFSRDMRKPISYSAHRELGHYVEYATELMEAEESGIASAAVGAIKQVSHELNAAVHAGQVARAGVPKLPHDDISEPGLRKFADVERRVFSNCAIMLAAYRRSQFDRLNARARAHFDWLVGVAIRKRIRQGPFGLPPT